MEALNGGLILALCVGLLSASPSASAAPKCKGTKQYYAGKCRYPAAIKQLKAKARAKKKRGTKGGKCYANKTCNEGLVCKDAKCKAPEAGTLGGACYGNGTCNVGLSCNASKTCDSTAIGVLGGPCYGNGTCNPGLVCKAKTCVPAPVVKHPVEDHKGPTHPEVVQPQGGKITRSLNRIGVTMDLDASWRFKSYAGFRLELVDSSKKSNLSIWWDQKEDSLHRALDAVRKQIAAEGYKVISTKVVRYDSQASRLVSYHPMPAKSGSASASKAIMFVGLHVIVTGDKGMVHFNYQTLLDAQGEERVGGFIKTLQTFKRVQGGGTVEAPGSKTLHYGHVLFDLNGQWTFERKASTEVSLEGVGLAGRPKCQLKFHRGLKPTLSKMSTQLRVEAKNRGERAGNVRTDRIDLTETLTMKVQRTGSQTLIWLYRTSRDRYELGCTGALSGTDWEAVDALGRSFKRTSVFAGRPIGR